MSISSVQLIEVDHHWGDMMESGQRKDCQPLDTKADRLPLARLPVNTPKLHPIPFCRLFMSALSACPVTSTLCARCPIDLLPESVLGAQLEHNPACLRLPVREEDEQIIGNAASAKILRVVEGATLLNAAQVPLLRTLAIGIDKSKHGFARVQLLPGILQILEKHLV
jgi:hypothetical protein